MAKQFSKIRSAAIDGRAHNPFYRKVQLKKLHDKLADHATDIQKAIADDTGHRPAEVKAEYWLALRCVAESYTSIDPEQHLRDEYAIAASKDAPSAREPVGIVVIEPTTHTFVFSLLSALSPALAAGNCVIIQVDQTMLKTPRLLLEIVESALDRDIVQVTSKKATDSDIGYRHVRVLQNGSPEPQLANHLVSRPEARVVAVVERDADLEAAAEVLVRARFGLRGKSPYAPDVVLVNEWVKKDFLSAVAQCSIRFMPDAGDVTPASASRRKEGKGFLDEVAKEGLAKIVSSGAHGSVLEIEDRGSFVIQRKLRESCLAIHTVTSMDDAIDLSKSLGRLAASFVFTTTPEAAKYMCQFLDSDLSFVNQIPASLLFGPVSPQGKPLDMESFTRYDTPLFTLPKPQFVSRPVHTRVLDSILRGSSPRDLQRLDDEATARLPEPKRLKKGGDIGFFSQGIVTGGIVVLSTGVTCAGVLCYYAVKFARPRLQGLL